MKMLEKHIPGFMKASKVSTSSRLLSPFNPKKEWARQIGTDDKLYVFLVAIEAHYPFEHKLLLSQDETSFEKAVKFIMDQCKDSDLETIHAIRSRPQGKIPPRKPLCKYHSFARNPMTKMCRLSKEEKLQIRQEHEKEHSHDPPMKDKREIPLKPTENPPQVMTPATQRVMPRPHQPPHADFNLNSLFMLAQHMQSTPSEKLSGFIDSGAMAHCVGNEIENI